MRILRLTVKKKWFDMLASGVKKEEYREDKQWIRSRLLTSNGTRKHYDLIEFKNGYKKDSPVIYFKYEGFDFGRPNPEWCEGWYEENPEFSTTSKPLLIRIKTNIRVK